MSKTVKDHFEDCKQVSDVIDTANALLTKCQRELQVARDVLEALVECQHPKIIMKTPYSLRAQDLEHSPPDNVIRHEIKRINELLGDRA